VSGPPRSENWLERLISSGKSAHKAFTSTLRDLGALHDTVTKGTAALLTGDLAKVVGASVPTSVVARVAKNTFAVSAELKGFLEQVEKIGFHVRIDNVIGRPAITIVNPSAAAMKGKGWLVPWSKGLPVDIRMGTQTLTKAKTMELTKAASKAWSAPEIKKLIASAPKPSPFQVKLHNPVSIPDFKSFRGAGRAGGSATAAQVFKVVSDVMSIKAAVDFFQGNNPGFLAQALFTNPVVGIIANLGINIIAGRRKRKKARRAASAEMARVQKLVDDAQKAYQQEKIRIETNWMRKVKKAQRIASEAQIAQGPQLRYYSAWRGGV
jgi:hypothetical protein